MTCKQCKSITVCMAEADGLGQVFDPNYDGEHGCTNFAPFTNADRIRAMSDNDFASFFRMFCVGMADCRDCPLYISGCPMSSTFDDWMKWLQQPAEEV